MNHLWKTAFKICFDHRSVTATDATVVIIHCSQPTD